MPSPPRSLDEAVQRIARALADDDGSGWWGEEQCGPGHVDAARRLAEAGGVSVLLERLQEVERERDNAHVAAEHARSWNASCTQRVASAEARVASLERALDYIAVVNTALPEKRHAVSTVRDMRERAREALAQGAAAPLPGDTG